MRRVERHRNAAVEVGSQSYVLDPYHLHRVSDGTRDGSDVPSAHCRGPKTNADDSATARDSACFVSPQFPAVVAFSRQPAMGRDHWALRLHQHSANRLREVCAKSMIIPRAFICRPSSWPSGVGPPLFAPADEPANSSSKKCVSDIY